MTLDPGIAVAVVTAIAALIAALSGRRKTDAETLLATNAAALQLLEPLSERVGTLEAEVAMLRKRMAQFRVGVRLLCVQIVELGAVPVWRPDDWGDYDGEEADRE